MGEISKGDGGDSGEGEAASPCKNWNIKDGLFC